MIGADMNKEMPRWRHESVKFVFWFLCNFAALFTTWIWQSEKEVEVDYEEFLGPNWRKELKAYTKPIATIVCNHSSFLDTITTMSSRFSPAYIARIEDKKSLLGPQAEAMQTLWLDRSQGKKGGDHVRDQLIQRQKDITEGKYSNICVFAESFSTNGKFMCRFKQGAFCSLLPVQPMVLKYSGYPEPPTQCCLIMSWSMIYALFGTLYTYHERLVLPPFIPNDYMFEKFKDKGTEKAHIYAWCVREAMSKASGIPTDDSATFMSKFEYMASVK